MGVGGSAPLAPARIRALLGSLVVVVAACTAPPPGDAADPVPGPTPTVPVSLRIAVPAPQTLDPARLEDPASLLLAQQIFDGLVSYDPESLAPVPAAAARWQVRDGGRRFIFHLRSGARFHDGRPVRAEDFAFAWSRLADPLSANPFAFLLERIEGFEGFRENPRVAGLSGVSAPGDDTLVVRLSTPWPDFVALLGHPALSPVPPGADRAAYGQHPVGNGPYRLAGALRPDAPVVLERFGRYEGSLPIVPTIEVRTHDDPQDAWPEFLAGEVDVAEIPPPLVPEAEARFGPRGIVTLGRLLQCGFNLRDGRFTDRRMRTAVSLAVDREAVAATVYGGLAEPATGIVPPSIPGAASEACGDRCRRDPDRARELLAEIPQRARSFAIDYVESPVGDRLTQSLAADLREVGFEIRRRSHGAREYARMLEAEEQEMFCLVSVADYPRPQALLEPLLHSGSEDNHTGLRNRGLDALLDEARAEEGTPERQTLYREAEVRALEIMPLVPLVWFRSHLAVQPYVQGFSLNPLERFDASVLSIEP